MRNNKRSNPVSPRGFMGQALLVGAAMALGKSATLAALPADLLHETFNGRTGKAPFVIHSHSTMRTGLRASDSVRDANCEARFVKRLFVADNSALANGLGGPNPTLTTQALATRTAEKIYTRYFGGRSWVDRESPVSSIDPSVTRALVECGHAGR